MARLIKAKQRRLLESSIHLLAAEETVLPTVCSIAILAALFPGRHLPFRVHANDLHDPVAGPDGFPGVGIAR